MTIPSGLPTYLIFVGAILAAIGGYLDKRVQAQKSAVSARQQQELTNANSEIRKMIQENTQLGRQVAANDAATTEKLNEILARSGDDRKLRELVEARSRLLATDRQASDQLLDEIISHADQKAKDYNAMKEAHADIVASRTREFLLHWEPLLSFVLSEFDRSIERLQAKGFPITLSKSYAPFTQSPRNSPYGPRVATYKGYRLVLQYNNAGIDTDKIDDAYYFIRVERISPTGVELEALTLRVGEKGASCDGKEFAAPANGIPPKELTGLIQLGIAKGIERVLAAADAEGK